MSCHVRDHGNKQGMTPCKGGARSPESVRPPIPPLPLVAVTTFFAMRRTNGNDMVLEALDVLVEERVRVHVHRFGLRAPNPLKDEHLFRLVFGFAIDRGISAKQAALYRLAAIGRCEEARFDAGISERHVVLTEEHLLGSTLTPARHDQLEHLVTIMGNLCVELRVLDLDRREETVDHTHDAPEEQQREEAAALHDEPLVPVARLKQQCSEHDNQVEHVKCVGKELFAVQEHEHGNLLLRWWSVEWSGVSWVEWRGRGE